MLNLKIKTLKSKKKKKGFTLIELVAVLAIIAILSAAFVPKVGNYITEAKKVAVLNEAKTVVTAYEAVSHKLDSDDENTTIETLKTKSPDLSTSKIPSGVSVSQCRTLLESNTEFEVSSKGVLVSIDGNPID